MDYRWRNTNHLRGGVFLRYVMKKASTETEHILRVICSDYPRRQKLLEKSEMPMEMLSFCSLLNQAVDEAIAEAYAQTQAYSPNFSDIMRTDIAQGRGFTRSPLSGVMCEGSYKKYKRMVKQGIAKRLGL